jgi:hypothetical protein
VDQVATKQATTHALKEWAVATRALEQGNTVLLLRKGGIHERGGVFTVAQSQVLLYPTYEHQKPHLLKAEYADQVEPVASGWHPETVRIGAWAEITHVFPVTREAQVAALLPYHIWNENFVVERFNWKPDSPIYVLLLRTYQLRQTHFIPYQTKYGGCKSWIDLAEPIAVSDSTTVLSDNIYRQEVEKIKQTLTC